MKLKHTLQSIQRKLRRLDAKAMEFAKWGESEAEFGCDPIYVTGYNTRGHRIGRRYDRIADKYGII